MSNFMNTTRVQLESLNTEMKKSSAARVVGRELGTPIAKRARSEVFEDCMENSEVEPQPYRRAALSGIHPLGRSGDISQPRQQQFTVQPRGRSGGRSGHTSQPRQQELTIQPDGRPRDISQPWQQQFRFQPGRRSRTSNQPSGVEQSRQRGKNVFHGKSKLIGGGATGETILAADITLVASGIGLRVETDELSTFLKSNDIDVVKVDCMTRKELIAGEKVKSKTMKVVVKAKDHEKAMNPDIWPFRVGVRYYKAESRRPGDGGKRQTNQEEQSGGLASQPASQQAGAGRLPSQLRGSESRGPPVGSSEWGSRRNQMEQQAQYSEDIPLRNNYELLENPEVLRNLGNDNHP